MISFIIPCYNSEKTIIKTIESIRKQMIPDSEVIIVDDGSTDNSKIAINEYIESNRDFNILYLYKENGGASSARNLGIRKATKKYIQFVDADDLIAENYYLELKQYLTKDLFDIIYYDYCRKYENGTIEKIKNYNYLSENELENFIIQAYSPCFFVVKKALIDKIGFSFVENIIYEDYGSVPYLGVATDNIKYLDKELYCYMQIGYSVTRTNNIKVQKKYMDIIPATENILPLLNSKYCDEIKYLIARHLLYNGLARIDNCNDDREIKSQAKTAINKYYKNNIHGLTKTKYFKKTPLKYKIIYYIYFLNITDILVYYSFLKSIFRRKK